MSRHSFTWPVATLPPPLTTKILRSLSYGLAGWISLLILVQLSAFTAFAILLGGHVAGSGPAWTLATAVVVIELWSLPFLYRLPLSPAARWLGAWATLSLPYLWLVLILAALMHPRPPALGGLALAVDLVWMTLIGLTFGAFGGRHIVRSTAAGLARIIKKRPRSRA